MKNSVGCTDNTLYKYILTPNCQIVRVFLNSHISFECDRIDFSKVSVSVWVQFARNKNIIGFLVTKDDKTCELIRV